MTITQQRSTKVLSSIQAAMIADHKIFVQFPVGVYQTPFYPMGQGVKQKLKSGWKISGRPIAARTPKIDSDGISVKFNNEIYYVVGEQTLKGKKIFMVASKSTVH